LNSLITNKDKGVLQPGIISNGTKASQTTQAEVAPAKIG
jgi:hypothetical protein